MTGSDKLDWDTECDGRMRDFQTEDDAVFTVPYVYDAPTDGKPRPRGLGLQLPAMLRSFGLTVELVPGWENRSAGSFAPHGAVCHWTAGAKTGDRGSLNVCIHGRPGLAGPLCNTFLCRSGVAVVVAAGRANHAGTGGWRGLSGNHSVWGTEAENSGYDAWTDAQRWAYPRVNAAYAKLSGFGADMVCGHSEWTTRKIDIHNYTMTRMRAEVAALLAGTGTGEEDMPLNGADATLILGVVMSALRSAEVKQLIGGYVWDASIAAKAGVGPAHAEAWVQDTRVILGEVSERVAAVEALLAGRVGDGTPE